MMNSLKIGVAVAALCLSGCAGMYGSMGTTLPATTSVAQFDDFAYKGQSQESALVKPTEAQYVNPILSGYYPDPSITRAGDDYYLVNSSFAHYPGLPIFHSKDLVNWVQIANAIDRPSQLDFKGLGISRGVFAPDISYNDGLFYIVNTCVDCKGNFVITATNPAGPWSDPVWFPFDGIDPSIFWDTDGKAYMINNGPPIGEPLYDGHRAIWIQEFDYKALKLVGERTLIVNGGVDLSTMPSWIEGPHIIRKDGFYYLIAAEGGTGDQHSEVVFRSESVRGPFIPHKGNPILSQRDLDPKRSNPVTSAGHAKFVQTQNGDWWATFLATRPYGPDLYNIGRETFLLPVTWKDGWPFVLDGGERIPFVGDKPNLPAQSRPENPMNGDFAYTETFDGPALPMSWIGMRVPEGTFYTLDGALNLTPSQAAIGDMQSSPAFIGRRQQHHVAEVSTKLSYTPQNDGDRAGLVMVQNDDAYLFFGLTRLEGKSSLALYVRESASDPKAGKLIASVPFEGSDVTLDIKADGGTLDLSYKTNGVTKTFKTDQDITFLSTRKAGGFVGTIIGLYAEKAQK